MQITALGTSSVRLVRMNAARRYRCDHVAGGGTPIDASTDRRPSHNAFTTASKGPSSTAPVRTRSRPESPRLTPDTRMTFVTTSQDWLFRAWRTGARMRQLPTSAVMAIPGQPRKRSYVSGRSPEHDFFAARMRDDPTFRECALTSAAIQAELEARRYRVGRALRSLVVRPITAVATRLGYHPNAPLFALRYRRRGGLVNAIRRQIGLGRMTR